MTDKHPEAITVQVAGKERTMKLGPAAFRLAQVKHKIVFSASELDAGNASTLAQLAYVAFLPDDPKLKEEDFLVEMANSDETEIIAAVVKSLRRMTEGLSSLSASGDTGNVEAGA